MDTVLGTPPMSNAIQQMSFDIGYMALIRTSAFFLLDS